MIDELQLGKILALQKRYLEQQQTKETKPRVIARVKKIPIRSRRTHESKAGTEPPLDATPTPSAAGVRTTPSISSDAPPVPAFGGSRLVGARSHGVEVGLGAALARASSQGTRRGDGESPRPPPLHNIIREGNTGMVASLIQDSGRLGMQSMDDALWALVQSKRVHPEDAYRKAQDKARFEKVL